MPALEILGYLLVGAIIAAAAKLVVRGPSTTSWGGAVLIATIITAVCGTVAHYAVLTVAAWLGDETGQTTNLYRLVMVGVAAIMAVCFMSVVEIWLRRRHHIGVEELIRGGESQHVEFKATARVNLHTGKTDNNIVSMIIKTIAGFANSTGGTLLIGVADDGSIAGLDPDMATLRHHSRDDYQLWLTDTISTWLGTRGLRGTTVSFVDIDDKTVCRVDVVSMRGVLYATVKDVQHLYVRYGNTTRSLAADQIATHVLRQRLAIRGPK